MAGKFQVDSEGFRRRVAWRGPFGVLSELVSNAFDEKVTLVKVDVTPLSGGRWNIRVEDDSPDGFIDLTHSYTIFADSYKANIPTKRGRFNFGEKVAIALCDTASILSTTGRVSFTRLGTIHDRNKRREHGTVFEGVYWAPKVAEVDDAVARLHQLIVPEGIVLHVNGLEVVPRKPIASFEVALPTVIEDASNDRALIRTERKTVVNVYHPVTRSVGWIYELGIPVVATGDVFDVDVQQKVPLSTDRNNVTPGYLKRLRAAVLNATYQLLAPETAVNKGVTDGLAGASKEAINDVLTKRFGEKRFVTDFNREATGTLTAENFTAVAPRTFDAETFDAIKAADALPSGNQLRPKLFGHGETVLDDSPLITDNHRKFRKLVELLAEQTTPVNKVYWSWIKLPGGAPAQCAYDASTGSITLTWNLSALGKDWFTEHPASSAHQLDLAFHELGHHTGAMDCTRDHANGITSVASQAAVLFLTRPEAFKEFK